MPIAVAVSGRGRSLLNLIKSQDVYEVAAVIASGPNVAAIEIAEDHGVPVFVGDFRENLAEELEAWLQLQDISWVALAGFLKPFPALPAYAGHVINIHPSLLPAYGGHGMFGKRVHEAVFAAKEKTSGASVHFVSERYDEGSLIAQGTVAIEGLENPEAIASAVFDLECQLYPAVIKRLIQGQLPLAEGRVWAFKKD